MPKCANRVPEYCRHRPTGQAYVWIDGRMIYLGLYGTAASRQRYDQIITEWIAAGRRLPGDPQAITVAEVVAPPSAATLRSTTARGMAQSAAKRTTSTRLYVPC